VCVCVCVCVVKNEINNEWAHLRLMVVKDSNIVQQAKSLVNLFFLRPQWPDNFHSLYHSMNVQQPNGIQLCP